MANNGCSFCFAVTKARNLDWLQQTAMAKCIILSRMVKRLITIAISPLCNFGTRSLRSRKSCLGYSRLFFYAFVLFFTRDIVTRKKGNARFMGLTLRLQLTALTLSEGGAIFKLTTYTSDILPNKFQVRCWSPNTARISGHICSGSIVLCLRLGFFLRSYQAICNICQKNRKQWSRSRYISQDEKITIWEWRFSIKSYCSI